MSFWPCLWKAVFVLGLTLFAGMSVWVIVAGARDVRSMCRKLASQDPEG